MLNKQVVYNVAMYLRLSKEDGDDIESESITNQRKIIIEYIENHSEMKLYNEYVDDGYSGANFNRPNFKKMLEDIENKKVNMVITKNLARFGRNYIETGSYIEKYFPDHRVRYIAILDRVDNFEECVSNDFAPIKSVFNEKHCKDTSISVKRTKRKKMQEGFYACNTPPFGYKKDPLNPGKLIIDEESSKTVKKIFELKEKGYSCNKIVKYLEENHYETPAQYLNIRGLEKVQNKDIWRRHSVTKILGNKVYLGHCVRGKTQNISYKSKEKICVKSKDFIIVPNTHEPIISQETFDRVHNNKKYGLTRENNTSNYLLKNYIFCKECGKKIIFTKKREKVFIYCRNNAENSRLCCNDCNINYNELEDKIFIIIEKIYNEYFNNTKVKENLYREYIKNIIDGQVKVLEEHKNNLGKINFKISALYNQRLSCSITEENYKNRYNTLLEQRRSAIELISNTEKEIEKNKLKLNSFEQKEKILKKISNISRNDFKNSDIGELIDKIEIFKRNIYVYFKFGEVENIIF